MLGWAFAYGTVAAATARWKAVRRSRSDMGFAVAMVDEQSVKKKDVISMIGARANASPTEAGISVK